MDFLRIPPSDRLEELRGELAGFWSLCINEQWRIIYLWAGSALKTGPVSWLNLQRDWDLWHAMNLHRKVVSLRKVG